MSNNHGKYTKVNIRRPRAAAQDDYSGFLCMHDDMIWQKEYRGTGLVNTGFLVNPRFADKPNPQNLTPLLRPDPIPVPFPRPCPQLTEPN